MVGCRFLVSETPPRICTSRKLLQFQFNVQEFKKKINTASPINPSIWHFTFDLGTEQSFELLFSNSPYIKCVVIFDIDELSVSRTQQHVSLSFLAVIFVLLRGR